MKKRYGKPNADKSDIDIWYTMGQKFFYFDEDGKEWQTGNPSPELLMEHGFIPEVIPAINKFELRGEIITPISGTEITYRVIDKDPEDIFNKKVSNFTSGVQSHLDGVARSWGYDSIISLCSYAADPNPTYSAEAMVAVIGRGEVWQYCYDQLELIKTGKRVEPESIEAFITELPAIERPE